MFYCQMKVLLLYILNNSLNITPDLISYLTTGLELIKVIEAEFYKILHLQLHW